MPYGIKVSKQGYDVKNADLKDLSFGSELNMYKIKMDGDISITVPANEFSATKIIYHNLGYEPAVLVFLDVFRNDNSKRVRLPSSGGVGFNRKSCDIFTDRIEICVYDTNGPLAPPPDFNRVFTGHYYIFLDPLPQ